PNQVLSKLAREILGDRPSVVVAIDDRKHPGAFPLVKVQAAVVAFQAASGGATEKPAPGAAGLFTPEQWQFLSAQPNFESFWSIIRPSLAGMAADMYRRFTTGGPSMSADFRTLFGFGEATAPPAPGAVKFFDATTNRGDAAYAH